jgi:hypothetical protein
MQTTIGLQFLQTEYRVTRPPPPKKRQTEKQEYTTQRQPKLKSGTAINQSDMIQYRNEIKLISDLCRVGVVLPYIQFSV